jgi:hypothetical protein
MVFSFAFAIAIMHNCSTKKKITRRMALPA